MSKIHTGLCCTTYHFSRGSRCAVTKRRSCNWGPHQPRAKGKEPPPPTTFAVSTFPSDRSSQGQWETSTGRIASSPTSRNWKWTRTRSEYGADRCSLITLKRYKRRNFLCIERVGLETIHTPGPLDRKSNFNTCKKQFRSVTNMKNENYSKHCSEFWCPKHCPFSRHASLSRFRS